MALARPPGSRAPLVWGGGVLAGAGALGLALYLALGLSVGAWREHPHEARLAALVALALLTVSCVRLVLPGPAGEEQEEDDDDGGQRRPGPTPPRGPAPTAPVTPPSPSWREFDEVRSEWERTPAGVP